MRGKRGERMGGEDSQEEKKRNIRMELDVVLTHTDNHPFLVSQ